MKIFGCFVTLLNRKCNPRQNTKLFHDSNDLLGICNIPPQRLCSTYRSQRILLIMRNPA